MDLQQAFDEGFDAVKGYVDRTFAQYEARLKALEARQPNKGDPGEPGQPGRDGPTAEGVADMVRAAVAAIPPPKDGKDGKDGDPGAAGKDWPGEDQVREIAAHAAHDAVVERMAGFPRIPQGPPGKDGLDGKNADPDEIIAAVLKSIRLPLDGAPGKPGADGKDGIGLAGSVIDRAGSLVVTLSDGSQKELGPVVGKDGAPGKDGRDGFNLEDFQADFDGERTCTLKFVKGDLVKETPMVLAHVLDRGVWKEGTYVRGDGVTWGGSFWIAQRETSAKPDSPDSGFRLAVKRGRDGKDGTYKPPREPQPVKVG